MHRRRRQRSPCLLCRRSSTWCRCGLLSCHGWQEQLHAVLFGVPVCPRARLFHWVAPGGGSSCSLDPSQLFILNATLACLLSTVPLHALRHHCWDTHAAVQPYEHPKMMLARVARQGEVDASRSAAQGQQQGGVETPLEASSSSTGLLADALRWVCRGCRQASGALIRGMWLEM